MFESKRQVATAILLALGVTGCWVHRCTQVNAHAQKSDKNRITLSSPDARAQEDAKDWPMYNRDVIGTRHNPGETAIDKSNAGRLEEKWRVPPPGPGPGIGGIPAPPGRAAGFTSVATATPPSVAQRVP